ncbi:hypothetical protein Bbelb_012490, partial [Branchiostoma belcheri]
ILLGHLPQRAKLHFQLQRAGDRLHLGAGLRPVHPALRGHAGGPSTHSAGDDLPGRLVEQQQKTLHHDPAGGAVHRPALPHRVPVLPDRLQGVVQAHPGGKSRGRPEEEVPRHQDAVRGRDALRAVVDPPPHHHDARRLRQPPAVPDLHRVLLHLPGVSLAGVHAQFGQPHHLRLLQQQLQEGHDHADVVDVPRERDEHIRRREQETRGPRARCSSRRL